MKTATVRAQAKLNLLLRVLARETSGYHAIETVFHRVELGDDVAITLRADRDRSVRTSIDVGPPEANVALIAAEAYCALRGWDAGFDIVIEKHIPAGGGMGGGSADAAAALTLLDALHPEGPLGWERLLEPAAQVGADVPFLVTPSPMAFAWGRGTRLMPLPALPQRHVALLFPPFGIGTATAYAAVDRHERPAAPLALDPAALGAWSEELAPPVRRWRERNDFAAALDADQARVAQQAMAALERAGAVTGGMTGSGSTLYGIFDAPPDARALARDAGLPVVLTRTAIAVERPTVTE